MTGKNLPFFANNVPWCAIDYIYFLILLYLVQFFPNFVKHCFFILSLSLNWGLNPDNLSQAKCIWATAGSLQLEALRRRRKAMERGQSASEKMRIYVGGLGAAMTEDDLRKVFHSVGGVVEAVDFVRTKSRSFAYVDFFPSSQSSLSKLFSTVSFSPRFHCQTHCVVKPFLHVLISVFGCDFNLMLVRLMYCSYLFMN